MRALLLGVIMMAGSLEAQAGQSLFCQFKGVGTKQFDRPDAASDFLSKDGKRWQTLETDQFLQLRSADIDPDYVTNPFTVYLVDKNTKRVRQISGAMRAAPMMADGNCELADTQ